MTRKDYERFAAMLKASLHDNRKLRLTRPDQLSASEFAYADHCIRVIISHTASIFEDDNERFDRARFSEACGSAVVVAQDA